MAGVFACSSFRNDCLWPMGSWAIMWSSYHCLQLWQSQTIMITLLKWYIISCMIKMMWYTLVTSHTKNILLCTMCDTNIPTNEKRNPYSSIRLRKPTLLTDHVSQMIASEHNVIFYWNLYKSSIIYWGNEKWVYIDLDWCTAEVRSPLSLFYQLQCACPKQELMVAMSRGAWSASYTHPVALPCVCTAHAEKQSSVIFNVLGV